MIRPVILVRYAEIGVKLGRVRRLFEKQLVQSIKCRLSWHADKIDTIRVIPGRIIVEARVEPRDAVRLAEDIALVFGVHEAIAAWSLPNDLETLKSLVPTLVENALRNASTFAVRVRRVEAYPLTSKELEKILGAEILASIPSLRVDLEHPDVTVRLEVRSRRAYLYLDSWRVGGVGGLPYGIEGNAIVPVLDPELDLFAAWLVARRGARLNLYYRGATEKIVEKFVEQWVPCGDASLFEARDPLLAAGERAARGYGLLVNSRVVSVHTSRGVVWSVSPLHGMPSDILAKLYSLYSRANRQTL